MIYRRLGLSDGGSQMLTITLKRLGQSAFTGLLALILICTATNNVSHYVKDANAASDPTSNPLLYKKNITYVGAFKVPQGSSNNSSFYYGGQALSYNPANNSLFFGGHDWDQLLGEIRIPNDINLSSTAQILQNLTDVTEGKMSMSGPRTNKLGGTLVYNGRLIVTGYIYYGPDGTQTVSHGVSNLNLSTSGDFNGFYQIDASAPPRGISGFMTSVPTEWQSILGGQALTGHCCSPGNQTTSNGPSATIFNPDDLGVKSAISGFTLIYYPMSNPLAIHNSQNEYYNMATQMGGMAFPAGSRSLLFFGRQGTGPYCYGPGTSDPAMAGKPSDGIDPYCYDPSNGSKGTHSYPYRHQVWAYDALDMLLVKQGKMQPYQIRPYAIWSMDEMNTEGGATMRGAAYDPINSRVFITEQYGSNPVVHLYKIDAPALPAAPGNLRYIK
jgi:hypothetical protein